MPDLASPVFIIGNPRSGTSLFRLLLTSHSKMVIPPECGFIAWLYEDFGNWRVEDLETKLDIFLDKLNACKKFDTWEIELGKLKSFLYEKKPESYSQLCASVYLYYSLRFHKDIMLWGDKNNFYIDYLEQLLEIYPQAKFIHLVRDGRDVYCSYLDVMNRGSNSSYAPKLNTEINVVANEWNNNLMKVESFFSQHSEVRNITIRYEDLIASPDVVLKKVFSWCGLNYESGVLDFFEQNATLKLEPEKTMDWKSKTKEPIDPKNSGKFKSILNINQIEQFNRTAKEALYRFGYK